MAQDIATDLNRISVQIKQGQLGRAFRGLQMLRAREPMNPRVPLMQSAIEWAAGDRDAALASLGHARALAIGDAEALEQVAGACMSLRAWDQALKIWDQVDPGRERNGTSVGRCLWGMGRYREAIEMFERAAARDPDNPEAWLPLWQCAERLGDFAAAARVRRLCQRWLPQHTGITLRELQHRVAEGERESAHSLLGVGREVQPDNMRYLRAELALKTLEGERPALESVLDELDPRTAAQLRGLDWALGHAPRVPLLPEATALLRKGLASAPRDGLVMEFGVHHGRSVNLLARWTDRTVHGFDSFQGLPEAWSDRELAGAFSTGGALPRVADNVALYPGWFEDTLPEFLAANDETAAMVHVDCHLYSSTRTVLDALAERCRPGTVLVLDELYGYPGYEAHEFAALNEFLERWSGGFSILGIVFLGQAAIIRLD